MLNAQDIIGLAITGVLTILWTDIRKVGKSRNEMEIESLKKAEEFRSFMFKTFLTRESHDEKCSTTLAGVSKSITDMKLEILKELRNGNK